jgi:hypothetical protein
MGSALDSIDTVRPVVGVATTDRTTGVAYVTDRCLAALSTAGATGVYLEPRRRVDVSALAETLDALWVSGQGASAADTPAGATGEHPAVVWGVNTPAAMRACLRHRRPSGSSPMTSRRLCGFAAR